jgi:hypothetical protein
VNRKTVAAAYVRLQREGLVQIRARSGIYLSSDGGPSNIGPLDRMRRTWLEQAYSGARAVGFDNNDILRIANAIGEVERSRVPVLASSHPEATALAAELHKRANIHAVPIAAPDAAAEALSLSEAPIVICTPWYVQDVTRLAPHTIVVPVTAPPELASILREAAGELLLVVAPDDHVAERIRQAVAYCSPVANATTVVASVEAIDASTFSRFPFRRVLVWPGCGEGWEARVPAGIDVLPAPHLASQETLDAIQRAVLDVALRKIGLLAQG